MRNSALLLFLAFVTVFSFEKVNAQTQNSDTQDRGVVINGVRWATRNVGFVGTFVESPEMHGNKYNYWRAMDACPRGWRVPTQPEFESLVSAGSVWTTVNGVSGRVFGSGGNSIFLPAAGYRDAGSGMSDFVGILGNYWSSTEHRQFAHFLSFDNGSVDPSNFIIYRTVGYAVRCVAE